MRRKMAGKLMAFLLTAIMILSMAVPAFAEGEEAAAEDLVRMESVQEEITEAPVEVEATEEITEAPVEVEAFEEITETPTEVEVSEEIAQETEEALESSTEANKIIYDSSKKAYALADSTGNIVTTYNGVSPVRLLTMDKKGEKILRYVYLKNGVQDKKVNGLRQAGGDKAYYFKSGIQDLSFNTKTHGPATMMAYDFLQEGGFNICGKVSLYVSNGEYNSDLEGVYRAKNDYYYFYLGILMDESVLELTKVSGERACLEPVSGLIDLDRCISDLPDSPTYKNLPVGFSVLVIKGKMDTSAKGVYKDSRLRIARYLTKGVSDLETNDLKSGCYMGTYIGDDGTTVPTMIYLDVSQKGHHCKPVTGFMKYGKSYYYMKDGLSPQDTIIVDDKICDPITGVVDQDGVAITGVKGTDNALYVNKGKLDLTKTGLVPNGCDPTDLNLYYVEKGVYNSHYNSRGDGLVKMALEYDSAKHKTANVDVYVVRGIYSGYASKKDHPYLYSVKDQWVYLDENQIALNNNYKNWYLKAAHSKAVYMEKVLTYLMGVMEVDNKAHYVGIDYNTDGESYIKLTNGVWDKKATGGYARGIYYNGGKPSFTGYYMKNGVQDTTFTGLAKTQMTMINFYSNEQKNTVSYKTKSYFVICYYENGVLVDKTGIAKMDEDFYLVKNGVVPSVTLVEGTMDAVTGIFYVEHDDDLLTKSEEGYGLHPKVSSAYYGYGVYIKNGKFTKYTGYAYLLDEDANVYKDSEGRKYKEKVNSGICE